MDDLENAHSGRLDGLRAGCPEKRVEMTWRRPRMRRKEQGNEHYRASEVGNADVPSPVIEIEVP